MRCLVLALLAVAVVVASGVPGQAAAQTRGQPWSRAPVTTYGQIYGPAPAYGPSIAERDGRIHTQTGRGMALGYGEAYGYGPGHGGAFGDPHAYRPPVRYGHAHDRGGRYGYAGHRSSDWTRWSSPPGRGYQDVYGYNDDRAPRGADHRRRESRDCYCGVGAYLYDR